MSYFFQREYQLGQPIGVDMKLKVQTDREYFDLQSLFQEITQHEPLTFVTLPLPLKSCRYHHVSLFYSPTSSQTKEATFVFSMG